MTRGRRGGFLARALAGGKPELITLLAMVGASLVAYYALFGGRGSHAVACVKSGFNILSLYGNRVPYNICRNLEWQVNATHAAP